MSLVVTSSSQTEYDVTSKITGGIQKPSSFQNFLNSPLILDKDTEVAVVSVKCNKDENSILIQENEGFYLYWGDAAPKNTDADIRSDINSALQIVITPGEYTPLQLATQMAIDLNNVVLKAYPEVSTIGVTANYTLEVFTGYSIKFTQRGDGSGLTDKPMADDWGAYIDDETLEDYNTEGNAKTLFQKSRNFKATNSISNVNIVGYNASFPSELCDCIGKSHPISMVNGTAIFLFNGSSVKDGDPDGYTIGLIRSQGGRDDSNAKIDFVGAGGIHDAEKVVIDDGVNLPLGYGTEQDTDVPFLWDVAFNWKPGSDGQVVQLTAKLDEDGESREMTMKPITTLFTPGNASLQAKIWDAVVFETEGEKMTVSLRKKIDGSLEKLVDGASTTFGERVKPFGITCNQLYPKVAIHQNNASTPGDVTLTTWNGVPSQSYYDKNFWGYGIDKELVLRFNYEAAYISIDTANIYVDGTDNVGQAYAYKSVIGTNLGISNSWTLVFTTDFDGYEPEFQSYLLDQNLDRMREVLGFDKDLVLEADATGAGTALVTFTSALVPSGTGIKTSMFVRLKNMAINSYNANKSSISNIIYSCPRYDVTGNTEGRLFYEPSERVYVSLNNTDRLMLNTLEIDFVDVNEKEIVDLTGNTVVVLHFRKKK